MLRSRTPQPLSSHRLIEYIDQDMVEVSLTVGKLDASLALLLTKDHHLIEFPTILLPNGVRAGSIVKIKCDQDFETEKHEANQFKLIQDEILNTFGKNLPKNPVLSVKNVTQTSCVLEWDNLDLGTSSLKNLFLFKDGKKLGTIPQPLTNKTTKLSGLPIDKTFEFQLRLDTTAGIYNSDILEVTTHKMTDLSGITVCLGDINANEQFSVDDIEQALKDMGANYPAQTKVSVDTTHFICTRENKQNPEYIKASEMNIPIIRPEWLKACQRDRRIVGVRDYYVRDCVLPDIFAKNFWNKTPQAQAPVQPAEQPVEQAAPSEPSEAEPQLESKEETKPEVESKPERELPPPPTEEPAPEIVAPVETPEVPETSVPETSEVPVSEPEKTEPLHEINLDKETPAPIEKEDQPKIEITDPEPVAESEPVKEEVKEEPVKEEAVEAEPKEEPAKSEPVEAEPEKIEKEVEPKDDKEVEPSEAKEETPEVDGVDEKEETKPETPGKKKKNNKKKKKKN